ncbi:FeS assembly protein SufB [Mycobacteroides abscessus subsp. abscessus]|nr:FeS assembly protein SufB [Mycobacteroides abscessus subsp. abscessus]
MHYVEGCTAPIYKSDSLHSAVVEIIVKKGGRCRYTTIQNWSNNVYNLVTKRAKAEAGATMEWIDGNIGSKVTMKYPAVWMTGEHAKGEVLSVATPARRCCTWRRTPPRPSCRSRWRAVAAGPPTAAWSR